jgi:putative SOS response-associated peptidase YedK
MCSNYRLVTRLDRLLTFFGIERERGQPTPDEIWPLGFAPFIRLHEDRSGNKVIDDGQFGLLPHFAKELGYGRKTYNARSETIDKLPSFKKSWANGHRCIVPIESVFEPGYETGQAVRWCIQQSGAVPMGIAGVYAKWHDPDGHSIWTFAMITVNADGHPVYQRMHALGEERWMVTILDPEDCDRWLQCTSPEAKSFFKQWQGPLDAFPAPLPPRVRKPR